MSVLVGDVVCHLPVAVWMGLSCWESLKQGVGQTGVLFCVPLCRPSGEEDRLVGLVVKASVSRAEDPGFESRL